MKPFTFPQDLHSLKMNTLPILLTGVIAISFAAPLFKLSQPTHPLVAAATRLSFAALLWLLIDRLGERRASPEKIKARAVLRRAQHKTAILCGLCYAVHFGAWVWSLGLTSVIASATLVTTTPIMLGFIGLLTGSDRPNTRLMLSGGVASIGVIAFCAQAPGDGSGEFIGDLLALLGALAMVPYLLLTRHLGDQLVLAPFSFLTTSIGAITLWVIAAFSLTSSELCIPNDHALYALFGAALIPQLIGHSALTFSLQRFTPTEVGLATLLEPIGASLLAWWWLNEQLSLSSSLAALITLSGVMIALPSKDR